MIKRVQQTKLEIKDQFPNSHHWESFLKNVNLLGLQSMRRILVLFFYQTQAIKIYVVDSDCLSLIKE